MSICTICEETEVIAEKLIKSIFGKELAPNYFGSENVKYIILEPDYHGIAIVQDFLGHDYLDKFGVDMPSLGIGAWLFDKVVNAYYPEGLFWRCNVQNQCAMSFYEKQCQKYGGESPVVNGKWAVFHLGNFGNDLNSCVDYALRKPETLS